jgi:hypothetical protein
MEKPTPTYAEAGTVRKGQSSRLAVAAVLHAALRPQGVTREEVDRIARVSNGPEFILQIRRRFNLTKSELYCVRQMHKSMGKSHAPGTYFIHSAVRTDVLHIVAILEGTK